MSLSTLCAHVQTYDVNSSYWQKTVCFSSVLLRRQDLEERKKKTEPS